MRETVFFSKKHITYIVVLKGVGNESYKITMMKTIWCVSSTFGHINSSFLCLLERLFGNFSGFFMGFGARPNCVEYFMQRKHFSMTSGLGADFCCGKFTKRSLWRCEKRCPKKHPMPSGQISSRPHTTDFPQMVVNSKGNPLLGGGFKYFLFSSRSLGFHDPI